MSKIIFDSNVRFLDPSYVSAHDADGNELKIKCKCGKKATWFAIGKEAYIGWCEDCLDDSWVVNLRKPSKWRSIMGLFKRKKKKESTIRQSSLWACGTGPGALAKQEYLDKELKKIHDRIDLIEEKKKGEIK